LSSHQLPETQEPIEGLFTLSDQLGEPVRNTPLLQAVNEQIQDNQGQLLDAQALLNPVHANVLILPNTNVPRIVSASFSSADPENINFSLERFEFIQSGVTEVELHGQYLTNLLSSGQTIADLQIIANGAVVEVQQASRFGMKFTLPPHEGSMDVYITSGDRSTNTINLNDRDNDGLSDEQEIELFSDISNPDTDNDGVNDGDEVNYYLTSPNRDDSDNDGEIDSLDFSNAWLHYFAPDIVPNRYGYSIENTQFEFGEQVGRFSAPMGDVDADGANDLMVSMVNRGEFQLLIRSGATGLEIRRFTIDDFFDTNLYNNLHTAGNAGDFNSDGIDDIYVGYLDAGYDPIIGQDVLRSITVIVVSGADGSEISRWTNTLNIIESYLGNLSITLANLGVHSESQATRLAACYDLGEAENHCQLLEFTDGILTTFAPVLPNFIGFYTPWFYSNISATDDVDRDGWNDLIIGDNIVSGSDLSVLYNVLAPLSETPDSLEYFLSVATVPDQNDDLVDDLLLGFSNNQDHLIDTLLVVSGADQTVISEISLVGMNLEMEARQIAAVGDIDGDSIVDYAITGVVDEVESSGDYFEQPRPVVALISGGNQQLIHVLDLRNDSHIKAYQDLFNGFIDAELTFDSAPPIVYTLGDVNGDGLDEFVLAGDKYTTRVVTLAGDWDGDGLSNLDELGQGLNPQAFSSDEDSLSDSYELNISGTDPLDADSDSDGILDDQAWLLGLDPNNASNLDVDSDGLSNLTELEIGTNPVRADTDGDGLRDDVELATPTQTNALMIDTDLDGLVDGKDPVNIARFVYNGSHSFERIGMHILSTSDVNHDAVSDLVSISRSGPQLPGQSGVVISAHSSDDGRQIYQSFIDWPELSIDDQIVSAALGDIDSDGVDDFIFTGGFSSRNGELIAISGVDGTVIYQRTMSEASESLLNEPGNIKALTSIQDRNGDSKLDLLLSVQQTGFNASPSRLYLLSGADGEFMSVLNGDHPNLEAGEPILFAHQVLEIEDIDTDGINDVLISQPSSVQTFGRPPLGSLLLFSGASFESGSITPQVLASRYF